MRTSYSDDEDGICHLYLFREVKEIRNWWSHKGIVFRPKKFRQYVDLLVPAWDKKTGGLQNVVPPETRYLPDWVEYASREHALLLVLFAWLNRAGVKGNSVVKKAAEIACHYPGIFDPEEETDTYGLELMKEKGLINFRRVAQVGEWQENLAFIQEQYGSDPRKLFLEISNLGREGAIKSIRQPLHGFGLKVASLLIGWAQEVDWNNAQDLDFSEQSLLQFRSLNCFPPDVWAMRDFRQHDLIKEWRRDHHHALAEAFSVILERYCEMTGIPGRDLAQASWMKGTMICAKKPKEPGERQWKYCLAQCPTESMCKYLVYSPDHTRTGRLGWDDVVPRKTKSP